MPPFFRPMKNIYKPSASLSFTITDMNNEDYIEKATLAGGCFWCMEPPFDALDSVTSTISGYAGGIEKDPSYEQVASGQTSHAEVIQISFDNRKLSYKQILDVYWRQIDPTTLNRQFADVGPHYRSAIFYHDEKQRQIAESSKQQLQNSAVFSTPIVTEIKPLTAFYPAEDYHQNYYQTSPSRYKFYRHHSGRDQFLEKVWSGGK